MADPELQLQTATLTPDDVAGHHFHFARRGYDTAEVDAFLHDVAEGLTRLQGELDWHRARAEHLERRTASAQEAAYARLARQFMDVLRKTDEAAARIRIEAEDQARVTVVKAQQEAERIVSAAVAEADRTLTQARVTADQVVREAMTNVERMVTDSLKVPAVREPAIDDGTEYFASPPVEPTPPEAEAPAAAVAADVEETAAPLIDLRAAEPEADPSILDGLDLDVDVSFFELFAEQEEANGRANA